jgi:uncharacterized membrane protein YczE
MSKLNLKKGSSVNRMRNIKECVIIKLNKLLDGQLRCETVKNASIRTIY